VPSAKPHRLQRGPASRVRIVVEHRGQRHNAGDKRLSGMYAADRKHLLARKLFIVARGNYDLFRTLNNVLREELDVEVIFDRRKANGPGRPEGEERRIRSDVDDQIQSVGYAVVRRSDEGRSDGNIRWR
jgi:hypothetical protein